MKVRSLRLPPSRRRGSLGCAVIAIPLTAACGGDPGAATPTQIEFGGDRPAYLEVPTTYSQDVAHPLLVVLHGYGANGFAQTRYTGLDKLVEEEGGLLIAPGGTVDADGKQFWNATDACCDFYGSEVDDVRTGWPVSAPTTRDLDTLLPGAETTISTYEGCRAPSRVELWTIEGGVHLPAVGPPFSHHVWAWMQTAAR